VVAGEGGSTCALAPAQTNVVARTAAMTRTERACSLCVFCIKYFDLGGQKLASLIAVCRGCVSAPCRNMKSA
jgi:hypothetical protein